VWGGGEGAGASFLQEEAARGGTTRPVLNTFYVTSLALLGSNETSKCGQDCCEEGRMTPRAGE